MSQERFSGLAELRTVVRGITVSPEEILKRLTERRHRSNLNTHGSTGMFSTVLGQRVCIDMYLKHIRLLGRKCQKSLIPPPRFNFLYLRP